MKKSALFRALVLVALLLSAMGVRAATENFSSNGMFYQLTTYNDGSGVITVENSGEFNTYSGVVNIPDSVFYNGRYYPVTGIGYQAFKNCTGLGLSEYVQEVRRTEACRLLSQTDTAIQEIGRQVGMVNVSSFIRFFKQQTGLTPGQYREKHAGMPEKTGRSSG